MCWQRMKVSQPQRLRVVLFLSRCMCLERLHSSCFGGQAPTIFFLHNAFETAPLLCLSCCSPVPVASAAASATPLKLAPRRNDGRGMQTQTPVSMPPIRGGSGSRREVDGEDGNPLAFLAMAASLEN